jgi:alpha/beta superfamily hydrolase
MQLMMRRPEVVGFVSATLPVHEHDFTFLAPCPSSGLVVHGGADTVVLSEQVTTTIEKIPTQKGIEIDFREIEDANHFFTHHLEDLTDTIGDFLSTAEPDMVEQTDD